LVLDVEPDEPFLERFDKFFPGGISRVAVANMGQPHKGLDCSFITQGESIIDPCLIVIEELVFVEIKVDFASLDESVCIFFLSIKWGLFGRSDAGFLVELLDQCLEEFWGNGHFDFG
jgi:hypothetical protein